MTRPVFGRDRVAEAWAPDPPPPSCGPEPTNHLLDQFRLKCVDCGWLFPDIVRCQTVGCDFPADYEAEVEDKRTGAITTSAAFCRRHMLTGGASLIPGATA